MDEIEYLLLDIKADMASLKTDVAWMKRLFAGSMIVVGGVFGIDISGLI